MKLGREKTNASANVSAKTEAPGSPPQSYRDRRRRYRREKQLAADQLLRAARDPAEVTRAGWLKVRGCLRGWSKLWCEVRPGLLVIYKNDKAKRSQWVGTVLLTSCQLIERPSRKEGFCFKLFHPLERSIWSARGPDGEHKGAVVQPLPHASLIFRAATSVSGQCWLHALQTCMVYASSPYHHASLSEPSRPPSTNARRLGHVTFTLVPPGPDRLKTPPGGSRGDSEKTDGSRTEGPRDAGGEPPAAADVGCPMSRVVNTCVAIASDSHQDQKSLNGLEATARNDEEKANKAAANGSPSQRPAGTSSGASEVTAPCRQTPSGETRSPSANSQKPAEGEREPAETSYQVNEQPLKERQQHFPAGGVMSQFILPPAHQSPGPVGPSQIRVLRPPVALKAETKTILKSCGQTQELGDELKSLVWFIMKQLRPGMDLSRIVLPIFVMEPRSFLEKLGDWYYHADYLSRAAKVEDPYLRMRAVLVWYLAGFYNKPKGPKKPFNPILGETLRCFWQHPSGSRTLFVAEQVSRFPPISSVHVSNRQDDFCLAATITCTSKFYGNSTTAHMEGATALTFLSRDEVYRIGVPDVHVSGLIFGSIASELSGRAAIECERTGYSVELDFRIKSMWSGSSEYNCVTGRVRHARRTLATFDGKWDGRVQITDRTSNVTETLWEPTPEVLRQRLPRFTVPLSQQGEWESERLWCKVAEAIRRDDQDAAGREFLLLEEAQRESARRRKEAGIKWTTKYFTQGATCSEYHYLYADMRRWDDSVDVRQYENEYRLMTQTRRWSRDHQQTCVDSVGLGRVDQVKVLPWQLEKWRKPSGDDVATETLSQYSADRAISFTRLRQCLERLQKRQSDAAIEVAALQQQLLVLQQRLAAADLATDSLWAILIMALGVQLVLCWLTGPL